MRLVEVTIPIGKRDTVLRILDEKGVDYNVTDETGNHDYAAVARFPLPPEAVDPVLDRLREEGLEEDAHMVVIDAQTVISRQFRQLEQRYNIDQDKDQAPDGSRPREEVYTRARELAPDLNEFLIMTVLSVSIATAGVLLDSAAVVVGSMVIAPLIGPAMATSVGTVLVDRELFVRGVRLQAIGGVLAIAAATLLAFIVKTAHIVPPGLDVVEIGQVEGRFTPGILSLLVAVGSGVAGAYSLTSGLSSALVGVAIAVALVPPTAVIGIAIAYFLPVIALGATILVLVNIFSINLGALAVFWFQGYRPWQDLDREVARRDTVKRASVLLIVIVILSSFLAGVTYSSYRTATIEQDIQQDVQTVLDRPEYQSLVLIDTTIIYRDSVIRQNPERVVVTVGYRAGNDYPGLAEDLAEEIDRSVVVEVRFTVFERTGENRDRSLREIPWMT